MTIKPTYEELQAQVEALRREIQSAADWFSAYWPELNKAQCDRIRQMDKIAKTTPQQHLAEIRAECVERALKTISHRWKPDTYGDAAFMRVSELKEYADKIRQGSAK